MTARTRIGNKSCSNTDTGTSTGKCIRYCQKNPKRYDISTYACLCTDPIPPNLFTINPVSLVRSEILTYLKLLLCCSQTVHRKLCCPYQQLFSRAAKKNRESRWSLQNVYIWQYFTLESPTH